MYITKTRGASALLSLIIAFTALPSANAIVNPDRAVLPNEANWTAKISIKIEGEQPEQYCTGVLIAPQVVLTVAHCVLDVPMEYVSVQIGHKSNAQGVTVSRKPAAVVYHGKFVRQQSYDIFDENENYVETVEGELYPGESPYDSDIAVIYLDKRVVNIRPVLLPYSASYQPAQGWRTYGWGYTGKDEDIKPDSLLTAPQDDHTAATAADWEDPFEKVIAAVRVDGDLVSGTCFGDSGGPLVDSRNVLIGLTSYSESEHCAAPIPTLFTKVSSFLDWQKRAVKLARATVPKRSLKTIQLDEIPVIGLE